jgi:hypothetical protein
MVELILATPADTGFSRKSVVGFGKPPWQPPPTDWQPFRKMLGRDFVNWSDHLMNLP